MTKPDSHKVDFDEIYEKNLFRSDESLSGQGSEVKHTSAIRKKLVPLLKKLGIKTFLDVPCGDFNWMRLVDLGDIKYIGGDIVEELVKQNQDKFGSATRNFQHIDITNSKLPQADAIFCRDCLVHLNYGQILDALRNIRSGGIKYLMATTFSNQQENKDLLKGIWRPLNLQKPPFNLSQPIGLINEEYFEDGGKWKDKCIGVWNVDDLKLDKIKKAIQDSNTRQLFHPLVSVIMPVYNGADYMREAIDSVLAQTYKNIEVILVNDGSKDNTEEIAKSYGDKIRYFAKENGGVASALNLALEKATGEYISWLSHDDVYYPDKLEKQVKKLSELGEKERHSAILYTNHDFINEKSEKIGVTKFQELHDIEKLNHSLYPLFNGILNGCTLLIPRNCFKLAGNFDENLRATQDYDLWFKMFPENNLIFMEDVLVQSRSHQKQSSKTETTRTAELDALWMKMAEGVSEDEKIKMYGSELNFYLELYKYVKATNRSKKVEKHLFGKIKKALESLSEKPGFAVANMATYPARKESLQLAVDSILPQVGTLNVYLNDFEEIPTFLHDPRINCVLGKEAKGDLKDNGKFYFLDKVPGSAYYFTVDDDIVYPKDYVSKMSEELKKYKDKAVVGVHGIIFHKNFQSFTRSRTTFHFSKALKSNFNVSSLGTGTVAFPKSLLGGLDLSHFESSGMADLWLAAYCKKHNVPLVCVKRESNWLAPVGLKQDRNLWDESTVSDDRQNEVIRRYSLWDFENSKKEKTISDIKVSVIIPFYNRIKWTIEAVNSVLEQTHQNFEVILVNDRSTEDISELEDIVSKDKRLFLINNKRSKGAGGARNTGIDNATGDYIAFLDADDLFSDEKLEKQLGFMVSNDCSFCHTSYLLFGSDDEEIKRIESGKTDCVYPSLMSNSIIATPTVMMRSDLFQNKTNRFPEKYLMGQDVCFWIKMTKVVPSKGIPEVLAKVRRHASNIAYDGSKQIKGMSNILEFEIENFMEEGTVGYIQRLNEELVKKGGVDRGKNIVIQAFKKKVFRHANLQISDNDLVGNKFNGHDLHLYLQERGVDSRQLVWNKESDDENTFLIARNNRNREKIYLLAYDFQKQYSLDSLLNPLAYDILLDPLFLNADLAHLHLVHNHIFDIQLLPLMTRLKPVVWTLHDPWTLGGHCIHHFECEKWKTQCYDCPQLKIPFPIDKDNSTLNFVLKKDAIRNSDFEAIVASEWMRKKAAASPVLEGKNIHVVPFGINLETFNPKEKKRARRELGIAENALVLLIRSDYTGFKGMDKIEYVLKNIRSKKKVVLLVLKSRLKENPQGFEVKEYGWVSDDQLLARIYSASDLFLTPSAVEAFGLMAVEAMCCGTLPIAVEGTALTETVNAPECGVVSKANKNDYLKTVQYYIDNERERETRAGKCLRFARERYDKEAYVEKILEVYKEAILRHELSEEDRQLLSQLKKNAEKMPVAEAIGRPATPEKNKKLQSVRTLPSKKLKKAVTFANIENLKHAKNRILERMLSSHPYIKLKEIMPKETRKAIRRKIKIFNKF